MVLHAVNHIRYAYVYTANIVDGRNDAEGKGILVGIYETATEVTAGAVTSHHPGTAFVAVGQVEAVIDSVFTQFDDFFDADSYVFRI